MKKIFTTVFMAAMLLVAHAEVTLNISRWDDNEGKSYAMRSKETAGDYRYFPDPNIMPVVIDDEWFGRIEASLPDLPEVKRARYIDELGLSEYDADQLVSSRALCDVFEGALAVCGNAKETANWINWIQEGKALYLNKEKVQKLIAQQQRNLANMDNQNLNSATEYNLIFRKINCL